MKFPQRLATLTVGGLVATAVTASLATLPASAAPSTSSPAVAHSAAAAATPTIKATPTTAPAGTYFVLSGTGTPKAAVTVQRQLGTSTQWSTFPATSVVTSSGTYTLRVQSGRVGVNRFRVQISGLYSPAVTVNITKATTSTPDPGKSTVKQVRVDLRAHQTKTVTLRGSAASPVAKAVRVTPAGKVTLVSVKFTGSGTAKSPAVVHAKVRNTTSKTVTATVTATFTNHHRHHGHGHHHHH